MFDKQDSLKYYGDEFYKKLKILFDNISSGGEEGYETYILVRNSIDSVCDLCPNPDDSCLIPDSLDFWTGSGKIMQDMDLREEFLYSLDEFLEKVKKLYPDRNPKK